METDSAGEWTADQYSGAVHEMTHGSAEHS